MRKIFINKSPVDGAYGGGNFFVINFMEYLINKGYSVVFTLEDNVDIIFVIDARKSSTTEQILKYKKENPHVKIIVRVNECDIKRKKVTNYEPAIVNAMKASDVVVFVSEWLRQYYINKYKINYLDSCAIINGCDPRHFHKGSEPKCTTNKIKLVTHHHSDNFLKGFKIYNALDKNMPSNIELTFIGNYNKEHLPQNIRLVKPLFGKALGDELRKHDVYLTATQNEPGGMHYVEGMACGMPVIYCAGGGGVHEVCKEAGEQFEDISSFEIMLNKICKNYNSYVKNIDPYFLSCQRCNLEYFNIIEKCGLV